MAKSVHQLEAEADMQLLENFILAKACENSMRYEEDVRAASESLYAQKRKLVLIGGEMGALQTTAREYWKGAQLPAKPSTESDDAGSCVPPPVPPSPTKASDEDRLQHADEALAGAQLPAKPSTESDDDKLQRAYQLSAQSLQDEQAKRLSEDPTLAVSDDDKLQRACLLSIQSLQADVTKRLSEDSALAKSEDELRDALCLSQLSLIPHDPVSPKCNGGGESSPPPTECMRSSEEFGRILQAQAPASTADAAPASTADAAAVSTADAAAVSTADVAAVGTADAANPPPRQHTRIVHFEGPISRFHCLPAVGAGLCANASPVPATPSLYVPPPPIPLVPATPLSVAYVPRVATRTLSPAIPPVAYVPPANVPTLAAPAPPPTRSRSAAAAFADAAGLCSDTV